jgi:dihydrodiol dehydrogenase / D-xylose 1-dehydrogenase (NADP)
MPDQPPPPLDDPTVTNLLDCPPLRWGIVGCGRVSHDFTQALKHVPTARVVACAARAVSRAQSFAKKHNVENVYASYEELVQDATVDIVYVGNVHSFRRADGELCIRANKHVVLEKPFACKREDAEYLIALAKEQGVFLMEGMWTRFFPAVEMARRLAFGGKNPDGSEEKGVIGEVVAVYSDFNFNASDSDPYPDSFLFNRKFGGGATLLTGPYPMAAATLFFGGRRPLDIKVTGQVDGPTGVDLQACIALSFSATSEKAPALDESIADENTPKLPGAGVATLSFGMVGESEEVTTVVGTKGRLTIQSPAHCPTSLKLRLKAQGRGNATITKVYDYPLPADTEAIISAGGFVYPNSAGFCYEAAAVARCIAAGKRETPQYTLAETLIECEMLDEARRQLGVKGVDDD